MRGASPVGPPRPLRRGRGRLAYAALIVGVAVVAAFPALARAATATVSSGPFKFRTVVTLHAAPGEATDVVVAWLPDPGMSARALRISDTGAVVNAGDGCEAVDTHTVDCAPRFVDELKMIHAEIRLEDGNDRIRFAAGPSGGGWAYVYGGPGDDVLDARNALIARIDAGGGRDELFGSTEYSLLLDGDRDGLEGDAAPGPDVFHGSGAGDMVSYRERTARVEVDLSGARLATTPLPVRVLE